MLEQQEGQGAAANGNNVWKIAIMVAAAMYVLVSGYLLWDASRRVSALEEKVAASQETMDKRVAALDSHTKATTEALADKLGITEKELAQRTSELQRQQRAAETRLTTQQKEQINAVTGEVASVKTDVGGVKTDVATTRSDLEATKAKLERAIGDLGLQSGLIAHTRDELEVLKHRGDRNIYEFTLSKNQRTAVSTISLQLKKADTKRSKFTLNVIADDKTIEKKDRTLFEPMQFYTGREHSLFEVVVSDVQKDKISGYLSTPKTAAQ